MDYKEKVIALLNSQELSKEQKEKLESIFPELKESEDEKVRKRIIALVNAHGQGMFKDDMLAWLEKQGEQKLANSAKTCKAEQKPNPCDGCINRKGCINCENGELRETEYNLTPKVLFKKGDWVVSNCYTSKPFCITKICDTHYLVDNDSFIPFEQESDWRLWTIQDAKDGDVLACESGWTCIFKTLVNDETFSSYCFMDNTKWFCETGSECHTLKEEFAKAYNGKIYPATKEQRDTLMKAMADAGYAFDFEKKELKKIEQKPAWSKEDETGFTNTIIMLKEGASLHFNKKDITKAVDFLKSLKDRVQPQNTWKPSEEQIKALKEAVDEHFDIDGGALWHLYQELKNLKE